MTLPAASPLRITVAQTGDCFDCTPHESLLTGMLRLGRKGIPVGCVNGGCGVCKVQVKKGQYAKRKMSRGVVSAEEEASGCVLACKIFPQSDLEVEVVGKMARAIVAQQSASSDFGFTTTMKTNKPVEEK